MINKGHFNSPVLNNIITGDPIALDKEHLSIGEKVGEILWTPIMLAVYVGNYYLVNMCLTVGAHDQKQILQSLKIAVLRDSAQMFNRILFELNQSMYNKKVVRLLGYAVEKGNVNIVKSLLDVDYVINSYFHVYNAIKKSVQADNVTMTCILIRKCIAHYGPIENSHLLGCALVESATKDKRNLAGFILSFSCNTLNFVRYLSEALHKCARKNSHRVARLILCYSEIHENYDVMSLALRIAVRNNSLKVLEELENYRFLRVHRELAYIVFLDVVKSGCDNAVKRILFFVPELEKDLVLARKLSTILCVASEKGDFNVVNVSLDIYSVRGNIRLLNKAISLAVRNEHNCIAFFIATLGWRDLENWRNNILEQFKGCLIGVELGEKLYWDELSSKKGKFCDAIEKGEGLIAREFVSSRMISRNHEVLCLGLMCTVNNNRVEIAKQLLKNKYLRSNIPFLSSLLIEAVTKRFSEMSFIIASVLWCVWRSEMPDRFKGCGPIIEEGERISNGKAEAVQLLRCMQQGISFQLFKDKYRFRRSELYELKTCGVPLDLEIVEKIAEFADISTTGNSLKINVEQAIDGLSRPILETQLERNYMCMKSNKLAFS